MTITLDQREAIIDSLRAGVTLDAAAKAARTTVANVRAFAADEPAWGALLASAEAECAKIVKAAEWAALVKHSAALVEEVRPQALAIETPAKRAAMGRPASPLTDDGAPDWERFRQEAADQYGEGLMGLYLLQDDRLVAKGLPRTSLWWLQNIDAYFSSALIWLIVMAGRGAGKSTTLERFLLVIAIFTERSIPPGQTWQGPIISVRPEDARRRIFELQAMLRAAYYIDAKPSRDALTITDASGNQIEIASMAATIGNVSGASTFLAILDEAAKLAVGGSNPDGEMVASLAETSRARAGWAGVRCSSAWETRGAHFASVTEGTNLVNYVASIGVDFIDECLAGHAIVAAWESAQGNSHGAAQIRAFAKTLTPQSPNVPTWVANPTIGPLASRLMLETLPKDDPSLDGLDRTTYWLRENASMPLSREGGPDFAAQCSLAAQITSRLAGRHGSQKTPGVNANGLMIDPHAPPGDPRYGGRSKGAAAGNWRTRKAF